ncbi:MAG: hypothetical protein H6502_01075 [Candidatus Woesearchaeota archaeon]|nr:MAG: hypothetical protein H6502_01075 [Candidatus Woesearchaeota archaeon]
MKISKEVINKAVGVKESSWLISELELYDIDGETEEELRTQVIEHIIEYLEDVSKIVVEVAHPENITSMEESACFAEEDMQEVDLLFRDVHYLLRKAQRIRYLQNKEELSSYLLEFETNWKEHKKTFITMLSKLENCWKEKKSMQKTGAYFI